MSASTLYYAEQGVEIHCGRVEDVLATIDPKTVALLSADVPYGIKASTKNKTSKRSISNGKVRAIVGRDGKVRGKPLNHDYPQIEGDDRPFDPAQLLTFPRLALWGANHYADKLPTSPSWILWDKRDGTGSNDNGDGEMAWTNLGGPVRIFRHLWNGTCRASETHVPHLHPTQKPVALYSWLFQWRTKPGDLIVAPYAGSGPDVLAARNLGRRIVAIECVEAYCEVIKQRLIKAPVLPMFAPPPIAKTEQGPDLLSLMGMR